MKAVLKTDPVAKRAIRALRDRSLAAAEGDFIGREDDLVRQLGISRPTLRLAASTVVQDQLLRVQRGVNGGYFAARPTVRAVARVAEVYLNANHATVHELLDAASPMRAEVARLAAVADAGSLTEPLEEFLHDDQASVDKDFDYGTFIRAERHFWNILGELCDNRVLQLFMEIVLDLAKTVEPSDDPIMGRLDRMQEMINRRRQVAHAVLAGDSELAALVARRCAMDIDLTGTNRRIVETASPIDTGQLSAGRAQNPGTKRGAVSAAVTTIRDANIQSVKRRAAK